MLALTRSPYRPLAGVRNVAVGKMDTQTEWVDALLGVETLIHLAAYQPGGSNLASEEDLYRQVNVKASEHLTRQAARRCSKADFHEFGQGKW